MRYRVRAADPDSAERLELIIEAGSLADAEEKALARGVAVLGIEALDAGAGPAEEEEEFAEGGGDAHPGGPEGEVWSGGPSQWVNFPWFLAVLLILPIPYTLWRVLVVRCERYTLTTQRLLHDSGVLRRRSDQIEIYRIKDSTSRQSVLQRIVGIGDVELDTSDRSHPTFTLRAVRDHRAVQDIVRERTEAVRRERKVREIDME